MNRSNDENNIDTVTINGRLYNKHTGMPIQTQGSVDTSHDSSALTLHGHLEKSATLSRRYVRKPDYIAQHVEAKIAEAAPARDYPQIARFANQIPASAVAPQSTIAHAKPEIANRPAIRRPATHINAIKQIQRPTVDPMVQHVQAARPTTPVAAPVNNVPKPSDILKKEAIETAMNQVDAPKTRQRRSKDRRAKKRLSLFQRRLTIGAGSLAILLIGAYFTYISMPAVSVRVAAAQAGIDASYPAYRPSGFGLSGAIAYKPGSVSMNFIQNGGKEGFTLTQENSGWDSSALLQNYVVKQAGDNYDVATDSGLTIYTFGNNAAWVSGGILYTIQGDVTLSGDQIQHIATSM